MMYSKTNGGALAVRTSELKQRLDIALTLGSSPFRVYL